jgi:hypothetical protein
LKQLQLIQILHVKICDAARAANEGAKARRVNRVFAGLKCGKGGIRGADTAC